MAQVRAQIERVDMTMNVGQIDDPDNGKTYISALGYLSERNPENGEMYRFGLSTVLSGAALNQQRASLSGMIVDFAASCGHSLSPSDIYRPDGTNF